MEVTLTYNGEVTEDGIIKIPRERFKKEVAKAFLGKKITLTVTRKKKPRSTQQNAFYWGVVLNILAHFFKEVNPDLVVNTDLVHEWCKERFLPIVLNEQKQVIKSPDGKETELSWTTTLLTTVQFMDYITLIQQWAAEQGIVIPDPNEWEFESVEHLDIDKR